MAKKLQTVVRKAAGLWLHPNPYLLPEGSLWMAENAVIDREGIISKRRGMNRYGDALSNPPTGLFLFDDTLIVKDGTTLRYDSDGAGTWAAWTGTFAAPDSDTDMTAFESNLNFYFLTSGGVYVNDATTGTPVRAGVPQGLDVQLAAAGTGASWFTGGTQVGYEVVFVREDANGNVKRGAPSFREVLTNSKTTGATWARAAAVITVTSATHGLTTNDYIVVENTSDAAALPNGTYQVTVVDPSTFTITGVAAGGAAGTCDWYENVDVTVTATLPDDIAAGDFYEVYRTELSASATTDPSERFYLIKKIAIASGDVTNGYVTFTDTYDEEYLGEPLYTNDTQEGETATNDRPPWAKYAAQYEGHTFYGNCKREHYLNLQFIDTAGLVDNTSSITITVGANTETYTFAAAEDLANKKFKRTTTYSAEADNVEATAKSLCKVINRQSSYVYAFYVSGVDDAPGLLLIRQRTPNSTQFSLTVDAAGTGDNFVPTLPTSGTTVASSEDAEQNVIYVTKVQQPEAAPLLNKVKLGRANRAILGLSTLKEALLVFKEDGIFLISGTSDGNLGATFVQDELDPTVRIQAAGTLALLDNAAWSYTDQGVMEYLISGGAIASRPVEVELDRIAKFTDFATLARAVAYESDRKYLLFLPEGSGDSYAKIVWCYNYLTKAWTTWRKDLRGGLVKNSDGKLYLMHAVDSYVLQERKSFDTNGADFVDETFDVTLSSLGTTTYNGETVQTARITWTYYKQPTEGWRMVQGGVSDHVVAAELISGTTWELTFSTNAGFSAAAAELSMGYNLKVEWIPEDVGNQTTLKQFAVCNVVPEIDGGHFKIGYKSDLKDDFVYTDTLTVTRTRGWGSSPWGTSAWGTETPGKITAVRSYVDRDHQICRSLSIRLYSQYAHEEINLLHLALDVRVMGTRVERS